MKKLPCLIAILLWACDNSNLGGDEARDGSLNNSFSEHFYKENLGDSILPYFEFDEKGNRIRFFQEATLKKDVDKKGLVLDSLDEFLKLETSYAKRIAEDADYSHSIERPLDYVCPTSWLAMNEDYGFIALVNGDTLLSDRILFEKCDYIGLSCDGCDDSAEEDPYLKQLKALKKEVVETATYDSKITVEIYPYRMIAESFISDYKVISTAGSETYFKKRQLVWRGPIEGKVWRWAAFDPDRNGIRSYCFSGCGFDGYGNFSCAKTTHDTDLDTCCDTEDITVRCKITPFMEFSISTGSVPNPNEDLTGFNPQANTQLTGNEKDPNFRRATDYGVVGMHYVRHKDLEFRAKTSKNLPQNIRDAILSKYPLSYR